MWVSRGWVPIGLPIGGYRRGAKQNAGSRHRARCRKSSHWARVATRDDEVLPRNRQSGTSISSVTASRQGNKRLKDLLIFSCNCLTRTKGATGRLLHQVPRAGHAARQGAQGAGAKEAEGHLRGHAGQGALRSLAEAHRADWSPPAEWLGVSMPRFGRTESISQLAKL